MPYDEKAAREFELAREARARAEKTNETTTTQDSDNAALYKPEPTSEAASDEAADQAAPATEAESTDDAAATEAPQVSEQTAEEYARSAIDELSVEKAPEGLRVAAGFIKPEHPAHAQYKADANGAYDHAVHAEESMRHLIAATAQADCSRLSDQEISHALTFVPESHRPAAAAAAYEFARTGTIDPINRDRAAHGFWLGMWNLRTLLHSAEKT